MSTDPRDAEITRLTNLREEVRESIRDMTEDNTSGATFEGRAINHLPLTELEALEAKYTVQINELIMNKQGLSYIFGQSVRTVMDIQRDF